MTPGRTVQLCKEKKPLIHCITNTVTANDCANILLACGGSAIMADDPDETAEITSLCAGLVLNIGTPSARRTEAMLLSGKEANRLGLPVVLDPVGAGSSQMRREICRRLLGGMRFAAIRGNASEIAALARGSAARGGVDADPAGPDRAQTIANAKELARQTGAVVIVTGGSDLITDGAGVIHVYNGHPMMRCVTGAGCQLSALLGAYLAANAQRPLEAALSAVCAMGLCGEIAHARLGPADGSGTYRSYIIDAVFHLTPEMLKKGANYETDQ